MKQKMLEHDSVFKNQVIDLHRFYRVQKNLMDEKWKKEQYEDRTCCETSSSSSVLPSKMTADHAQTHRQSSSSFLFTNSVCGGPPASGPEYNLSSAGDSLKGKDVQDALIPLKNCANPKKAECRPTKLRKMIDLELPPDEYTDTDEMEQCADRMISHTEGKIFPCQQEKSIYLEINSESGFSMRKPYALADLNEPPEAEETTSGPSVDVVGIHKQDPLTKVPRLSEDASWPPKHWSANWTQSSLGYNDKGNVQNWFSSALKAGGSKDNGMSIHQVNHFQVPSRPVPAVFENYQQPRNFSPFQLKEDPLLAKANNDSIVYEKCHPLSSFNNPGGLMTSHRPSYPSSSDWVNSWNLSTEKPINYPSQKPMSVQMTPFFISDNMSKSSHSSAQGNGFHGTWWHRNADPRSIPAQNGFYHGSSSDRPKELPPYFSNPGRDFINRSGNDNSITGSSSFFKATHSFDLNATRDLNLNVLPNDLSNEDEAKRDDPVSVLPWLRGKASNIEAARSTNNLDKLESGLFHDPSELFRRHEVRNTLDHQSCITSMSSDVDATRGKGQAISEHPSSKKSLGVPNFQAPLNREQEIDSGKKKLLFDINVALDDPEVLVEKIESQHSNGFRNMIDLNSCLTEDEIPYRTSLTNSSTTANSMKKPERFMIDLEAPPVDLEAGEESSVQDEESFLKLTRVAAEAIVAMSSSAPKNHVDEAAEEVSGLGDVLSWFVGIICSSHDDVEAYPDDIIECLSDHSDSFEEMTLNLSECTVDEYFPKPPNFDIVAVEEAEATNVTGKTRRTRRGRQRKDFQRDILPGLTSLARHEITEDVQTLTGLMRASGYAWNCGGRRNSTRNGSGRGRRRTLVAVHPVSPQKENLNDNGEIILEDRSLTSWGKTRRPRRQRCPPSSR